MKSSVPPVASSTQANQRFPRTIAVIGISGCGKTTVAQALAKSIDYTFIDADDYHSEEHKLQMASGIPLTDQQRESWIDHLGQRLQHQHACNQPCVLAFSGLKRMHRQRLRHSGVQILFFFLNTSPSIVADRLKHRQGHFMPASLLKSQLEALEPPVEEADVICIDSNGPATAVVEAIIGHLKANAASICETSFHSLD